MVARFTKEKHFTKKCIINLLSQCIFKCLSTARAVLSFLEWKILRYRISKRFLFFNKNVDMHINFIVLLNVMVETKAVGFGILLSEMFLLCFCSFLYFKFHVRKGKLFYLESSWKEKFPFSPISTQPLSARNSKPFPWVGGFTRSSAGRSPRPGPPKGRSSFQPGQGWGALPGKRMWETYFAVAFFEDYCGL